MAVHEFPRDGERLWRSLEPELRALLLPLASTGIVDEVIANLAPVVRRAGDQAKARIPLPNPEEGLKNIDRWVNSILADLLTDLAIREAELIGLRLERNDLLEQLRGARKSG